MALCKPDLVAAVLRQLGHEVPDPQKLTKAVFDASQKLRKEQGIGDDVCLLMTPVRRDWYENSVRKEPAAKKGGGGYASSNAIRV